MTNDYLGSPRINTDAGGTVTARHDYMPFGEEIATTQRAIGLGYTIDAIRRRFTVYQRDEETDLDYARLRMYSNRLGRFFGPDPVLADIHTPTTQNRYQYCLNNPLRFVDSGGGYDEEVHRDLTAALAVVAGFSKEQGNFIGRANQWLDDPSSGLNAFEYNSDSGYANRVNFHFTDSARRNDLEGVVANQVSSGEVNSAIGTFLHAEQDSFSHAGMDAKTGQLAHATDNFSILTSSAGSMYNEAAKYDRTTNDPAKAVAMARDTIAKLLQIANNLQASGKMAATRRPPLSVDDKYINDKLWTWARTEGRDAKGNILFDIMRYASNYYNSPEPTTKPKRKKKTRTTVTVVEEE